MFPEEIPASVSQYFGKEKRSPMTSQAPAPAHHQMTVLLVDDSPANLVVFGDILRPEFNVRVANSGQRALEIVETDPVPDIILLDVMMPKMDGYEVMKALQDHPKQRDIPVIFVTSVDASENVEQALALGAVDFISKPIKPGILLARINTHLKINAERLRLKHQNELLQKERQRLNTENQLLRDTAQDALKTVDAMQSLFTTKTSNPLFPDPSQRIGDTFPLDLESTRKK